MLKFLCAALAAWVLGSCGGGGGADASGMGMVLPGSPLTAPVQVAKGAMDSVLLAGPVSVVNTTTANDQVLRAIGATAEGGYIVAWISSGQILYLQAYDAAGGMSGSQVQIPLEITAPTQVANRLAVEQSSLAVLSDGSVVVLYSITRDVESPNGSASTTTGVFFQVFSVSGTRVVPETEVASQPFAGPKGPYLGTPAVVALSDGGFVVASALAHYSTRFASISTLSLYWFDSRGQPVGAPAVVGDFPELRYALVADAHGGLTLSTSNTSDNYRTDYTVFHYGADHTAQTIVAPRGRPAVVLPLENGYVLFAIGGEATVQRLDSQGNPVGESTTIASLPVAARELADGTYVVFWFANGAYVAERFAADGTSLGQPVPIDSSGAAPSIAALADPGFAAAWTAASANGDSDVYTQRFTERLSDRKRACLNSAKAQGLKGQERKAFVDACMA